MGKRVQQLIVILCFGIAVACIGYLIKYYVGIYNSQQVYEELQEDVEDMLDDSDELVQEEVEPEKEEIEDVEDVEDVEEPSEPLDIPIDFDALHEINPDIYAWIEIEGTNISYPILQSSESDIYYLEHTVEGVKTTQASIYTEFSNGQDFDVFNTIIYGHNMKNGSMFGDLSYYRDLDYMNEYGTIMIYTENSILEYEIYAATTFDNRHLLYNYNFDIESECQRFLDDILEAKDLNKALREGVEVTTDDYIITLSTCVGDSANSRLLVEAVLVNEQRE